MEISNKKKAINNFFLIIFFNYGSLNTKLESEGADFLVLYQLVIEKITAYKTYTNMPGYDLVAVNPGLNTSAKIQVKNR